jgi:SAM-dependent MidA family methyltransferase
MTLKNQIISEIKSTGGMTIDRYMEICNTHYYTTRDPLGAKGDFTTAPEISQIFGEMIAVWAITAWERIGKPEKCALLELGAGRGTLMKDFLRAIKVAPQFQPEVHLVEFSPILQEIQRKNLGDKITWHKEVPALSIPTILIANEFFDALPIKQFCSNQERLILESGGELYLSTENDIREESPVCTQIMQKISSDCAAGIIIDYGYQEPAQGDTFQALRKHKFHNILQDCGEADLTAHVNFSALERACLKPSKITTQAEFLLSHGADIRAKILGKEADLERLASPLQMGSLFKVLTW